MIELRELIRRSKSTPHYFNVIDLLLASIQHSPADGLFLEFGYGSGYTASQIVREPKVGKLYSFDSFDGLPEYWNDDNPKGSFSREVPSNVPDRVELVVGLYKDTLPLFLASHAGPVAFAHIDCDLYSSTKTVLDNLEPRFVDGTVLNFNEFWDYPGQAEHEAKAFVEFLNEKGWTAEPIGWGGGRYTQAVFKLRKTQDDLPTQ